MRFSFVLALLPLFAACNSTNSTATSGSEQLSKDQEFEVIELKYASATETADTIAELLDARPRCAIEPSAATSSRSCSRSPRDGETRVLADPRTNSLLVTALAVDMVQLKELIAALDVEVKE